MVIPDTPIPLPEGTLVVIQAERQLPSQVAQIAKIVSLFPPEDLAEIEDALRDCRNIDQDGW